MGSSEKVRDHERTHCLLLTILLSTTPNMDERTGSHELIIIHTHLLYVPINREFDFYFMNTLNQSLVIAKPLFKLSW